MSGRSRRKRRGWTGLLIPALLLLAVLVALGTWQLHRKAWKENLIATLDTRLSAPPEPLPPPESWQNLSEQNDEYRRVHFRATVERGKDALVLATGSAFRPDVTSIGFWVFAPARLPDGSIVALNRGFVPSKVADTNVHYDAPDAGPVEITGVLRWPDVPRWFTPKDQPLQNVWYARDPAAIAAARHWGAVSPFYVEQEAPVPTSGLPHPGKLVVHLRNEHLQYAITWYGLALALMCAFGVWAVKSRREGAA